MPLALKEKVDLHTEMSAEEPDQVESLGDVLSGWSMEGQANTHSLWAHRAPSSGEKRLAEFRQIFWSQPGREMQA